jgi:hypothetical protein
MTIISLQMALIALTSGWYPVMFADEISAVRRTQTSGTSGRLPPAELNTLRRSSLRALARFVLPPEFGILSTVKLFSKSLVLFAYLLRSHAVAAFVATFKITICFTYFYHYRPAIHFVLTLMWYLIDPENNGK